MKISTISFVFMFFAAQYLAAESASKAKLKYSTNFSTARDFTGARGISNVKLKNTGTESKVVYGLYVRQFSYVTPGQSCANATSIYASTANTSAGSLVMPVNISAGSDAMIGANYLYNMIYNAQYYVQITIPSSPPGCHLPGCTWGADTTVYNWCIYLGAMAPVSVTASYTSKVVPSTTAVSGGGFDYNLASDYYTIGPISCDDQTLTCSVEFPQTQFF